MTTHASPAPARRFAFGRNWQRFLRQLDEDRIRVAMESLRSQLGEAVLAGKSFLDVGCGSGLFSLAAMRLGAGKVHSFDFDGDSVACAETLRSRYFPQSDNWSVEQGSILDPALVERLGTFDVVYAWGVLHHTGALWTALDHTTRLVGDGGVLQVAIYNDQGMASRRWAAVKRLYVRSPLPLKGVLLAGSAVRLYARTAVRWVLRRPLPGEGSRRETRGMYWMTDLVDWVGGYPFEVATPEQVIDFCGARGFSPLHQLLRRHGHGCNEFVFRRGPA